ncbi:MAG: SPOR domain-containing protein [Methylotenera sp.]|nr:SPOR domain-containing protein [Methylotenera sp.]
MSPELPKDLELSLKKRARRRLVGAIALVLLMVIILPMILQDRTAPAPKDAIKITMEEASEPPIDENATQQAPVDAIATPQEPVSPMVTDNPITEVIDKVEPKTAEKVVVPEPVKTKPADAKQLEKISGSFAIQVGVYSDLANVKQLQAKLKEAGFASHTEKIATSKGEKIRLRVGKFPSRQEAADALNKLKQSGFSGMVISND